MVVCSKILSRKRLQILAVYANVCHRKAVLHCSFRKSFRYLLDGPVDGIAMIFLMWNLNSVVVERNHGSNNSRFLFL